MATRFDFPYGTALDGNGNPRSGDKLFFYEEGTSTKLATYSEDALTTPNANPVVADSSGRFGEMHLLPQNYKVIWAPSTDADPPTSPIKTWATVVGAPPTTPAVQDISGGLASTGSSNAYAVATNQTIGALAAGQRITFIANHANTAAATLNVDGLGAKAIKKQHDQDTESGDIELDQIVDVAYKATEDVWQMLSQQASLTGADLQNHVILSTEQATTSGTAINFTGIPSWVKKIKIMFVGVSTNGTSTLEVRIGDAGGVENTGYLGSLSSIAGATTASTNQTDGFGVAVPAAANIIHGTVTLTLEDAANFTWVSTGIVGFSDSANNYIGAGSKSLSAALDRVQITMANGTDAFDAGAVNILYE